MITFAVLFILTVALTQAKLVSVEDEIDPLVTTTSAEAL